ncbi:uncharacterized protein LY89DRAFT_760913 [Mollisia scopiformis]|uniref:Uncharacterized protein n=1 Tax=Mollisia scopiformis TaxID=149040 RepID=A0A132BE37_MOLSC|nr:uncharacterized protein LY89DRAFT_760913 [Mollisia scopiformis]KUJ10104.1 hypothetical protein LY89DRAFT_760913 [Mollisia scopiformis]
MSKHDEAHPPNQPGPAVWAHLEGDNLISFAKMTLNDRPDQIADTDTNSEKSKSLVALGGPSLQPKSEAINLHSIEDQLERFLLPLTGAKEIATKIIKESQNALFIHRQQFEKVWRRSAACDCKAFEGFAPDDQDEDDWALFEGDVLLHVNELNSILNGLAVTIKRDVGDILVKKAKAYLEARDDFEAEMKKM